jgi:hypothetical protein
MNMRRVTAVTSDFSLTVPFQLEKGKGVLGRQPCAEALRVFFVALYPIKMLA